MRALLLSCAHLDCAHFVHCALCCARTLYIARAPSFFCILFCILRACTARELLHVLRAHFVYIARVLCILRSRTLYIARVHFVYCARTCKSVYCAHICVQFVYCAQVCIVRTTFVYIARSFVYLVV